MSVNNVFEVKSIRTTNRTNGKLNWVVTIIVICFDWRINNQIRILWILMAIVKLWRFLRQSVLKLFGILECVVYMTFILIMFYWSKGFHLRLKPLFLLKKNPLHLANFRFFFFLFRYFGKPVQFHFNPKYNLRNFEMIELVHDSLAE